MTVSPTRPSQRLSLTVVVFLLLIGGLPVLAQNASLDITYSSTGYRYDDVGTGFEESRGIAVQADGKIVAAGRADEAAGNADFAVVRYNADGSPDTSFDGDGKVFTTIGLGTDVAFAVAIQPDGKIVAAGYAAGIAGNLDFAVVRYNADGSLDTTFDGDGRVTTALGPSNDVAFGVAIQPDGKIVAVGFADGLPGGSDFAVARYNADGTPDTSFDVDGIVTAQIGPTPSIEFAYAVVMQPDGKIIAAGQASEPGSFNFALARFNTDGSLDTSFDGDGQATFNLPGGSEYVIGIALYPAGRVVVAGSGAGTFLTARIWLNLASTAADATISGRVIDSHGRGIQGAVLTLVDSLGQSRHAMTNTFGYYRFYDVEPGQGYMLSISARRYTFAEPLRYLQVTGDLTNVIFTGETGRIKPRPTAKLPPSDFRTSF